MARYLLRVRACERVGALLSLGAHHARHHVYITHSYIKQQSYYN
jgi:hypothetical protein